jgi:hypothetical protein
MGIAFNFVCFPRTHVEQRKKNTDESFYVFIRQHGNTAWAVKMLCRLSIDFRFGQTILSFLHKHSADTANDSQFPPVVIFSGCWYRMFMTLGLSRQLVYNVYFDK